MKPFTTQAYIHSLNREKLHSTEMGEITVLGKLNEKQHKVKINSSGVICAAIFNPFNCTYYADDIYEIIKED